MGVDARTCDYTKGAGSQRSTLPPLRYNREMKMTRPLGVVLALASSLLAQTAPKSVTVPVTLDHNRTIVDVRLPLPDGKTTRVRAWVDTGNPELWITADLAKKLGLILAGDPRPTLYGK